MVFFVKFVTGVKEPKWRTTQGPSSQFIDRPFPCASWNQRTLPDWSVRLANHETFRCWLLFFCLFFPGRPPQNKWKLARIKGESFVRQIRILFNLSPAPQAVSSCQPAHFILNYFPRIFQKSDLFVLRLPTFTSHQLKSVLELAPSSGFSSTWFMCCL